ncbi:hypothetical protein MFIFM68171_06554 [Madurella fahalii]|uniref:Uncharacterized protein n=1 Tax=Madurella fahalii TaxID=1157608 RepID=A0ABQ0GF04_9PEZI
MATQHVDLVRHEEAATLANRLIHSLDLEIGLAAHDPLSRRVRLCVPGQYKPVDVRAMLDQNEGLCNGDSKPATDPATQFLEDIPVWAASTPNPQSLKIDPSTTVLCLSNLSGSTLSFVPRNATLPKLLPSLSEVRHLGISWDPAAYLLRCKRCHRHYDPSDQLPAETCPKSTRRNNDDDDDKSGDNNGGKNPCALLPLVPDDVLSLWPAHFPRLESLYVVVDTDKHAHDLRLRDGRELPDVLPESVFRSLHGTCYDVLADEAAWEGEMGGVEGGPRWFARVIQTRWLEAWDAMGRDSAREVPRCSVLGLVEHGRERYC